MNGVTTQFRMAGNLLVSERTGTEKSLWYRYDSAGNVISVTYDSKLYIYIRNVQNDIIGLIDSKGNEVVRYTYDSWGKVASITGSMAGTLGQRNPFRYRGYYYDTETGMYYLKSRYYDPGIRRFISSDTVMSNSINGMNLFAYCENNPVNMADYDGHFAIAFGIVLGIVGTYALGKIATSESVQTSSRNFVDSVARTVVNGRKSTTDYWREDYKQRVEERMLTKLLNKIKDELKRPHKYHIVAQFAPMAAPARTILNRENVNINVNSDSNYVMLSPKFHWYLHTNIYYGMVNFEIINAYYQPGDNKQQAVKGRLGEIRIFLQELDARW